MDDVLVVLEEECTGSDREPTRRDVYFYGMPTFLAALHCPCVRERMAVFLSKLTAPIALPRRYLAGITRHLTAVSDAESIKAAVETVGGDDRCELATEPDAISRGNVVRRFWGRGPNDTVPPTAPAVAAAAAAANTGAPSPTHGWTIERPSTDTVLSCLQLLCGAFDRNARTRGLFLDTSGAAPLIRVVAHYGAQIRPGTPANAPQVQCFVAAVFCYAILTAEPQVIRVDPAPFQRAIAQSGVLSSDGDDTPAAASAIVAMLTCALGLAEPPASLVVRFGVNADGCAATCRAVWRVLGGSPPYAAPDDGPLQLRHPSVLPVLFQLVTAGMAEGTGSATLVDRTLDFVGGLVAYEANGVAACEAGLLSTVLESFRDALADTSHAQHDRAVWLTRTLGAQKMSGREVGFATEI